MVNVFCLFQFAWVEYLIQSNYSEWVLKIWVVIAFFTNLFFLVELILHILAFGTKWIFKMKKVLILEMALQVCAIVADVDFFSNNYQKILKGITLCCVVYLFRSFRLLYLISEIEAFDLIFSTFLGLSAPVFTMCLSLYTIFYVFANVGMICFGALITTVSS